MTTQEISKVVSEALKQLPTEPRGVLFTVLTEMTYQDEDELWHVFVRPDREIPRRGAFYDFLNDIEKQVEVDRGLNVMIVPVKYEQSTSKANGA